MADFLASIFGTERDKVNCSFYYKIGACRHGEKCTKQHNKPTFSQTVLFINLYKNPKSKQFLDPIDIYNFNPSSMMTTDADDQKIFDEFFQEVFLELNEKYGDIEEMNICDNVGEHLVGNVYVKFHREEDAAKCTDEVNNRWFNGFPIYAELSPVTDFREACCRQFESGECTKGGFCNFMHLKPISKELQKKLFVTLKKRRRQSRSRSVSPAEKRRSKSRY